MAERPKERKLEVKVIYGDLKADFVGAPEEVYRGVTGFLARVLPTYELASHLTISVEPGEIMGKLEGLVGIAPEGVVPLISTEKLTDRDLIMLHLVMTYLSNQLGKSDKDSLSTSELVELTKKAAGGISARLSDLVDVGWVARVGKGEYKVTTLGLRSFVDVLVPRLKASAG